MYCYHMAQACATILVQWRWIEFRLWWSKHQNSSHPLRPGHHRPLKDPVVSGSKTYKSFKSVALEVSHDSGVVPCCRPVNIQNFILSSQRQSWFSIYCVVADQWIHRKVYWSIAVGFFSAWNSTIHVSHGVAKPKDIKVKAICMVKYFFFFWMIWSGCGWGFGRKSRHLLKFVTAQF